MSAQPADGGRRSSTCRSFASRPSATASIGALLFRIGIGATPFLLPLLLQVGFGMTPFAVGHDHLRRGDRRDRDEVRRAADPAPLRLPQRAPRQHRHRRRSSSRCRRPSRPTTPVAADDRRSCSSAASSARCSSPASTRSAYADIPPERMSRATTLTSVAQQLSLIGRHLHRRDHARDSRPGERRRSPAARSGRRSSSSAC